MGSLNSYSRNNPVSWLVIGLFQCISHAKASKAMVTNLGEVGEGGTKREGASDRFTPTKKGGQKRF